MSTSHTPGPWRIEASPVGGTDVVAGGQVTVCHLDPDDGQEHGSECCDAVLIAAAPDLLEQLKAVHYDCRGIDCEACAVIARAEGR